MSRLKISNAQQCVRRALCFTARVLLVGASVGEHSDEEEAIEFIASRGASTDEDCPLSFTARQTARNMLFEHTKLGKVRLSFASGNWTDSRGHLCIHAASMCFVALPRTQDFQYLMQVGERDFLFQLQQLAAFSIVPGGFQQYKEDILLIAEKAVDILQGGGSSQLKAAQRYVSL